MAYSVTISDPKAGIKFTAKYQNLAKAQKPSVEAKTTDGKVVKEHSVYQGAVLLPGSTQRLWVDDSGQVYSKSDLTFWYGETKVQEISQTKEFIIEGYSATSSYTDSYVISKYYELFPSDNGMKKDFDRERARISNLNGMKKLWDKLMSEGTVARGEMCVSSKGFLASDAYLRALKFGNKWGLEMGIFSEEKVFEHLQEDVPAVPAVQTVSRLKIV